jgi:hypothetical protein
MNDEITDQEREIWSAIRYLDPDQKHKEDNSAAIIIPLVLALLVFLIWVVLYLRD